MKTQKSTFQEERLKLEQEIAITQFKIEQLSKASNFFSFGSIIDKFRGDDVNADSSFFSKGIQIYQSIKNLIQSISALRKVSND